jgi:ComF family protein
LSNRATNAFDSGHNDVGSAARRASLRRAVRALHGRIRNAARLALPQHCELCAADAGDGILCSACGGSLPRVTAACPTCALPSADGTVCGACLAHSPPWSRTTAALVYAFPVDRLLQQLKYAGRLALADWAGEVLARSVHASLALRPAGEYPDRVVAVPRAPTRPRERGFNQAREIAGHAARAAGLPLTTPLNRVTATAPQAALAWKERASNVRGAFAVAGDVRGARIALVDDVMTTGATLAEATRMLTRAGAADVECWVVARTLRPNGD